MVIEPSRKIKQDTRRQQQQQQQQQQLYLHKKINILQIQTTC